MNRYVRRRSRCSLSRRRRICAWTVTSRAETASSKTRICGSSTSARAMATRWRCPPESAAGLRPSKALPSPTMALRRAQDLPRLPLFLDTSALEDHEPISAVRPTLECELLERRRFASQVEARVACFSFIEGWYNPARLHSAPGYRSPSRYEQDMQAELLTTKP